MYICMHVKIYIHIPIHIPCQAMMATDAKSAQLAAKELKCRYIYICIYIPIYIYIYIYTYIYIYIYACIDLYLYTFIYMYVSPFACLLYFLRFSICYVSLLCTFAFFTLYLRFSLRCTLTFCQAMMATDAKSAQLAARELFERIDRPSLIDPSSTEGATLPTVQGDIEVRL